jgi:hypothetical protein
MKSQLWYLIVNGVIHEEFTEENAAYEGYETYLKYSDNPHEEVLLAKVVKANRPIYVECNYMNPKKNRTHIQIIE